MNKGYRHGRTKWWGRSTQMCNKFEKNEITCLKPSVKEERSYSFVMTWGGGHLYDPTRNFSHDNLLMEPWNYGVRLSYRKPAAAVPCCSSKARKKMGACLKIPVDGVLAFWDRYLKKDA
ncbi:uncharacterized protein Bfra_012209 [Botrytis fragariae]|uniref:Uncharacterized protein n=1 Tax=Botrytis fragariae TaxID=1964551 RepID=A0A8H6EDR5_9HELO|nr:uncharacterized protein Bfra_012209 [Botrytis fragariae]KAF5868562.1 hypothetical protein Bfra_012209 [Botrytis fragariae]